jgi:3-oxoacyl-[acyl-carrier protein] reductase
MDMGLIGKRALITGSSTGLGKAIAEMFAAEGASVVVHGRNQVRADEVVESIRAGGGAAIAVLGDLTSPAEASAVAAAAGDIDILVNNAGYYSRRVTTSRCRWRANWPAPASPPMSSLRG